MSRVAFESLRDGNSAIVPYAKAWAYQKDLVERRVRDEIPDTFLFVEHPPTVTRGRGLQRKPGEDPVMRAMPLGPLSSETEYFEIERGGDLTWHGPGQLVIYPIVKLDGRGFGPSHDVTGYLRKLERVLAEWLGTYGLRAFSKENAAGIWVASQDRSDGKGHTSGAGSNAASENSENSEKKIASIGIAVRKWVAFHGIGLNIANTFEGFHVISPCGFSPDVMTTLERENPAAVPAGWDAVRRSEIERELSSFFVRGFEAGLAKPSVATVGLPE